MHEIEAKGHHAEFMWTACENSRTQMVNEKRETMLEGARQLWRAEKKRGLSRGEGQRHLCHLFFSLKEGSLPGGLCLVYSNSTQTRCNFWFHPEQRSTEKLKKKSIHQPPLYKKALPVQGQTDRYLFVRKHTSLLL